MPSRRIVRSVVRDCRIGREDSEFGDRADIIRYRLVNGLEHSLREFEKVDKEECKQNQMRNFVHVSGIVVRVVATFSTVVSVLAVYNQWAYSL